MAAKGEKENKYRALYTGEGVGSYSAHKPV
jgi:hypothetical protein